jgi:beta-lactamase regulating signal transducer with metallopeptidase domain
MSWIPETIIRALCWTLLHSLWQGLILAVVAGVVMVLTKRAKSATRYTILGFLVIGFLAVSGFTFFRELRMSATNGGPVGGVVYSTPPLGQAPLEATPGASVATPQPVSAIGQLVQYFNTHASVVVVVWFIVFLARTVTLLSGLVYAQRIRHYQTRPAPAEWQERLAVLLERLGITRPVGLLESALIKVPVVVGWLKPVILLPIGMLAQLPADQVESILLHELAHISRRDYLFNFAQHFIDTMYFFNPALLWVSSLIRTERENCCDDVAIRETRSRRKLIEALVSFHEYQQSAGGYVLGFAGKDGSVVRRVERIVHKTNHSLNAGERALLLGGVVLLCGAWVAVNTHVRAATRETVKQTVVTRALVKSVATTGDGMARTRRAAVHVRVKGPAAVMVGLSQVGEKGGLSQAGEKGGLSQAAEKGGLSQAGEKGGLAQATALQITAAGDTTPPAGTMAMSDVDKIMKARDHGVTTEFLSDLKNAGYTVSLEEAIRLKDHGVSVGFLLAMQKEGFGHISIDEAVRLIDHGVSVEFIQRIRALGFPDLTLEDAVTLVDHGVRSGFIEKWKKKTGSKLELHDYIRLQDAGIQPD